MAQLLNGLYLLHKTCAGKGAGRMRTAETESDLVPGQDVNIE